MQNLDARLASFEAITKPKSKAKPAFPLSSKTHPHLTADALSKAGFYHTPGSSEESLDNCTCFLCNVELGGWDEEDDPFQEHSRRGNCAWAEMICTVKIEKRKRDMSDGSYTTTYSTQESLPQSKESAAVREQTFKKWWPHKQKSGWLPTVKNLAQAGFVYTPSIDSKDSVMCPYCEYAVEGWEATDDPWQIHQNKVPDCHFFRAELEGGGPSQEKPAKSTAKGKKSEVSKRSKRATTAAQSVVSEVDEEASQATELPSEAESVALSQSTTTKKKATKPRATTTRKTAARGKKKAPTVEPEEEPEIVEVADDTITAIPPSQLTSTLHQEPETETEEPKGRNRRATKAKPRATTAKSKSKKKKAEETQSEVEPSELESGIEGETENEMPIEQAREQEKEVDSIPQNRLRQASKPSSSSAAPISSQSKSSRSKAPSSKPLPPLPPSRTPSPQHLPLSQLDRFSNIPPSSPLPNPDLLSPKPKNLLRSSQPQRSSPRTQLPREVLDNSLTRGAVEARKVMEDLMSSPVGDTTPIASRSNGTTKTGRAQENEAEEIDGVARLTDEQRSMTLEDLVRLEMKKRYQQMQREGEDMIHRWEERAKSERKRIEAI
ncbi:uncharacterized protein I303_102081 [Kwoniella dejecticola CBS 10117]|uniref:BIR-domain-containing protein n=1 Tax=Kwoniella dejecticola CBS 10117 TaxID=1296121 RepID=A0A1A6ABZ2_9TREE|nr:uncharacterized protein I303_01778 [Kwoniella dejecticola CBS 10117]OBR87570.1 hypothetical protein I303_01778 [Kwoniella dejecticola CBS 10117]